MVAVSSLKASRPIDAFLRGGIIITQLLHFVKSRRQIAALFGGALSSLFYQFSINFLTFFQIKGTKWGDFAPFSE